MGLDFDDLKPGLNAAERAGGLKRLLRIALGVILVLAGIAMLVLPGQGILTIIIGLNLIKPDNRLVGWLRAKTPGIPDEGPVPRKLVAAGVAMFVAMTVLSLIFGETSLRWARNQI